MFKNKKAFNSIVAIVAVVIAGIGLSYMTSKVNDSLAARQSGDSQVAALFSSWSSCPKDYVCIKKTDVAGLYRAYLAASSTANTVSSTSVSTKPGTTVIATSSKFYITSPSQAPLWKKGSRQVVGWYADSSFKGEVKAYLIPTSYIEAVGKTNYKRYTVMSPVDVKKGSAPINNGKLDKVPYGRYYLMIEIGKIYSLSKYTVEVDKHDDPSIVITSPVTGDTWDKGTTQRVTWTANFVKEGSTKDDPTYKDIRFVPRYGIDYAQNDISVRNISTDDKKIIINLSETDKAVLATMSPNQLDAVDPTNVSQLPGISDPGKIALSKLSPEGYSALKSVDFLNMKEMSDNFVLKSVGDLTGTSDAITTVTAVATMNPAVMILKGAGIANDLFGDDKPETVKATLYIVDENGTETKLKSTYIEAAKSKISLKNVKPGKYKIKIVAKLKSTTVEATSGQFTVREVK